MADFTLRPFESMYGVLCGLYDPRSFADRLSRLVLSPTPSVFTLRDKSVWTSALAEVRAVFSGDKPVALSRWGSAAFIETLAEENSGFEVLEADEGFWDKVAPFLNSDLFKSTLETWGLISGEPWAHTCRQMTLHAPFLLIDIPMDRLKTAAPKLESWRPDDLFLKHFKNNLDQYTLQLYGSWCENIAEGLLGFLDEQAESVWLAPKIAPRVIVNGSYEDMSYAVTCAGARRLIEMVERSQIIEDVELSDEVVGLVYRWFILKCEGQASQLNQIRTSFSSGFGFLERAERGLKNPKVQQLSDQMFRASQDGLDILLTTYLYENNAST